MTSLLVALLFAGGALSQDLTEQRGPTFLPASVRDGGAAEQRAFAERTEMFSISLAVATFGLVPRESLAQGGQRLSPDFVLLLGIDAILNQARPIDPSEVVENARILLRPPDQEEILVSLNGYVTRGSRAWKLEPEGYLNLYFKMEHFNDRMSEGGKKGVPGCSCSCHKS